MEKTRRDFLQSLLVVGASAGLLQTLGCGDDDGTGTDGGGGGTDGGGGGTDSGGGGTDGGGGGTDGGGGGTDSGGGDTDGGGGDTDGGMSSCSDTVSEIGSNHPMAHVLTVPIADVIAGVDKSYDIMGASAHNHTVAVTAANFATIAGGGSVMITSSSDAAHTHMCTVSCAT